MKNINSNNGNNKNAVKYKNKEWLKKQYCDKRLSAIKIAKKCGVQKKTIYYWLRKYGIAIRSSGESRLGGKPKKAKKRKLKLITKEILVKEYAEDGDSMKVIAERHGCSEGYIRSQLIKHDIEIREQYGRNGLIDGKANTWYYQKSHEVYEEFWREPVPEGYLLHHVDRNPRNFDITNQALVTRSFHSKAHETGKYPRKKKKQLKQIMIPFVYTLKPSDGITRPLPSLSRTN